MDGTAGTATSTQEQQPNGDGRYGVLLYYKYAEVPDAPALAAFYEARCRALALVGRVRVGPDGVNATVSIPDLSPLNSSRRRFCSLWIPVCAVEFLNLV